MVNKHEQLSQPHWDEIQKNGDNKEGEERRATGGRADESRTEAHPQGSREQSIPHLWTQHCKTLGDKHLKTAGKHSILFQKLL